MFLHFGDVVELRAMFNYVDQFPEGINLMLKSLEACIIKAEEINITKTSDDTMTTVSGTSTINISVQYNED